MTDEIPPLPAPLVMVNRYGAGASTSDGDGGLFTADQMREYALAAVKQALAEAQPKMPQWPQRPPPVSLRQRFAAWRERTGFLMDGRDGAM